MANVTLTADAMINDISWFQSASGDGWNSPDIAVISASASEIVLERSGTDEDGTFTGRLVLKGSFTYTSGDLSGGTITGFVGQGKSEGASAWTNYITATSVNVSVTNFLEQAGATLTVGGTYSLLNSEALFTLAFSGNDSMTGGAGQNFLDGSGGNDTLVGGAEMDYLLGGDGNDVLDGGTGEDMLEGGAGDDTYIIDSNGEEPNVLKITDDAYAAIGEHVPETASSLFQVTTDVNPDTETSTLSVTRIDNPEGTPKTYQLASGTYAEDPQLFGDRYAVAVAYNASQKPVILLLDLIGNTLTTLATAGANGTSNQFDTVSDVRLTPDGRYAAYTLVHTVWHSVPDGYPEPEVTKSDVYLLNIATKASTKLSVSTTGGAANGLSDSVDISDNGEFIVFHSAATNLVDGSPDNPDNLFTIHNPYQPKLQLPVDSILEDVDAGTDLVKASISYTLGDNLENLTLTGTASINGTGNTADNYLTGNAGNNVLEGDEGNDTLDGGAGNDTLDGGISGSDSLIGGAGNDVYHLHADDVLVDAVDTIVELANGGTDTVVADFSYTLGSQLENLTLDMIEGEVSGTGNELANLIKVSDESNASAVLSGLAGNDTLQGGIGNDLIDGGAGTDSLLGGDGADTLIGGGDKDTLDGGEGSDYYVVTDSIDVISDSGTGAEDIDTVSSSASYTLGNGIETLELTGTTNINGTGNAANNFLSGNTGDNVLNGGLGVDTLSGGAGNDTYIIDSNGLAKAQPIHAITPDDQVLLDNGTAMNPGYSASVFATEIMDANDNVIGLQTTLEVMDPDQNIISINLSQQYNFDMEVSTLSSNGLWAVIGAFDTKTDSDVQMLVNTSTKKTSVLAAPSGYDEVQVNAITPDGKFVLYTATNGASMQQDVFVYDTGSKKASKLSVTISGGSVEGMSQGVAISDDGRYIKITSDATNLFNDGGVGEGFVLNPLNNSLPELPTDEIVEDIDGGTDLVKASISYVLADNLENLELTGKANINGTGNDQANILTGNEGNNLLIGGAGADLLKGMAGNDTLNGADDDEADTLQGGLGNDVYIVGSGDVIQEDANGGTDEVRITSGSIDLSNFANVENITLLNEATNATGNSGNNQITGNELDNVLTGLGGNDTLLGGAGSDSLDGGDGNDSLIGGAGNDTLIGGAGKDTLVGGDGSDVYVLGADATDVINETGTGEMDIDTVQVSASYTLGNTLENLELTGSGNINGTGSSLANLIIGNSGDNVLNGAAGADTLVGGAGNDTYEVDALDIIVEDLDGGTDTVKASANYTLGDNLEVLLLQGKANLEGAGNDGDNQITGNSGNNVLTGGAGNDTLDGGAGKDTLSGGDGDDFYIVDAGDVLLTDTGGNDTVQTSASITLAEGIENLILSGTAAINGVGSTDDNVLTGNSSNNLLSGLTGNDTLIGGAGNDTLSGGEGGDYMEGGAGSDVYEVDSLDDVVVESDANSKTGGVDLVKTSIDYTLGNNLENLTLTGSDDLSGTGNSLANVLTGNAGDNVLNGGIGIDTLVGGDGNDIYVVDNAKDVVTETNKSLTQIDTVISSVSWTLLANLENLELADGAGNLNGKGNALANTITGNEGNNLLQGDAGNDTLIGGAGNDTLEGGAGTDAMSGGDGNDLYKVDLAAELELITEDADAGTDTVELGYNVTVATTVELGYNLVSIENLTAKGTGLFNLTGNDNDNVLTGNAQNNVLSGGAGNDTLIGGLGNDTLSGGDGDDVYSFTRGQIGVDVVTGDAGTDEIAFNSGKASIDKYQLWFRHTGDDLEVSIIGTKEKVTVQDWYRNDNDGSGHVERISVNGSVLLDSDVDKLVQAMSSFTPPASGQTSLTTAQHNALDAVIVANWQTVS